MEKELQDLVEQLGSAIDEAIAESAHIGEIVHDMERAGYDLTLVLEATMRLSPKVEQRPFEDESDQLTLPMEVSGRFELTTEDQEFLQAMKVGI